MTPLLTVDTLSVTFEAENESRRLLRDVSLELGPSEILGLVGESGSGKSLLCRTIIGLKPSPNMHITGGDIRLGDTSIPGLPEREMINLRGRRIGMIFQNPTSHLNPLIRIGDQICEGLRRHRGLSQADATKEAINLLDQVGFPDPPRNFRSYAHEFSGGMRQRAMIAIALACDPEILIADEPTTALDVTIQAQILELLVELRRKRGLSIILITHDLGVVAQTCDRIAVMQEGRIVETGEKRALLSAPQHPYTQKMIASHPSFEAKAAGTNAPATIHPKPVYQINDLEVRFPGTGGWFRKREDFRALAGVSLEIMPGETVGIVGESGSGKSTLARTIMGLTPIASGAVSYAGDPITATSTLTRIRHEVAMVFQDPYNALNPRMTVAETLREVLLTQGETPKSGIDARCGELLDMVGLDRSFLNRRPGSLSGGQCQRVGIARALAVNPNVIIADESVAALDVTIQAQIIDLFRDLSDRLGLTLIFIAHDLAIVRDLCSRVVVMHHGRIVETGPTAEVFANPSQSYTADLIAAIPNIDPDRPLARAGHATAITK